MPQRSGKQAEIQVQPSYGLTDEQVESMILEAYDAAEVDFHQRLLIEARNEAATILRALEKGRANDAWKRLSLLERTHIEKTEQALRRITKTDDFHAIRAGVQVLNQATMRLAELMMDAAVTAALKGESMEEAVEPGEAPVAGHAFAKADIDNSDC